MNKSMIKTKKIALLRYLNVLQITILALLFTACSDSTEETSIEKKALSNDITISQNDNAYEMKVKSNEDVKDRSYYYSYNEKKADKTSIRTAVDANMNIRSPEEEITTSLLVKKLSKTFILRCSPCHNDYGNGILGPSLLEKDADYIYETILQYRSGEKKSPLMKEISLQMSESMIKELSVEIQNFNRSIQKLRQEEGKK